MPAPAEHIWLPGTGVTDLSQLAVKKVDLAVQEYDENLRFGRNEDTGQWCVFLVKRGAAPLPVLGFPEVPHPDDALKRLHRADALRRGEEILDEMNRSNDALNAHLEDAVKDGIGTTAEAFEWGFRSMGKGSRVVVPLGKRASQVGGWS